MEFCNLIGAGLKTRFDRTLNKSAGIPLRISADQACSEYGGVSNNVWVQFNGEEVDIIPAGEGSGRSVTNNLFALSQELDSFVFPPEGYGRKSKQNPTIWASVQETEENPVILVICKAIHLVSGVTSYIKLLNVNEEYIVAMLVCGAVGFEDGDGEVLFMTRNLEEGVMVERRGSKRLSPAELDKMIMLVDKNGYKYNMDTVISLCAYTASDLLSVRVMRSECAVFDPQASVRAQALADKIAEAARLKEERLKAEKELAEKRRLEQARKDEEQRLAEKARKAAEDEAKRQASREKAARTRAENASKKASEREIKTPEGVNRNAGAELFLSMLGKNNG